MTEIKKAEEEEEKYKKQGLFSTRYYRVHIQTNPKTNAVVWSNDAVQKIDIATGLLTW